MGSIPGLGRPLGEENGNPLQYPCLESPMNRGVWPVTVYVVTRVGHDLTTSLPPKHKLGTLLVAQRVKSLPATRETRVRSLGWEISPGERNGNPFQYSCLENPMDREVWGLQSMGSQESDMT